MVLEVEYADAVTSLEGDQCRIGVGTNHVGLTVIRRETEDGLVDVSVPLGINALQFDDCSVGGGAGENELGCGDR